MIGRLPSPSAGVTCMAPHKITLSTVFAGQKVGVKQVAENIWLVSFMHYDLGFFDLETTRLEPIANPFEAKVLPMCAAGSSTCPRRAAPRVGVDHVSPTASTRSAQKAEDDGADACDSSIPSAPGHWPQPLL